LFCITIMLAVIFNLLLYSIAFIWVHRLIKNAWLGNSLLKNSPTCRFEGEFPLTILGNTSHHQSVLRLKYRDYLLLSLVYCQMTGLRSPTFLSPLSSALLFICPFQHTNPWYVDCYSYYISNKIHTCIVLLMYCIK